MRGDEVRLTTRNKPRRAEEIVRAISNQLESADGSEIAVEQKLEHGLWQMQDAPCSNGSLYWILASRLVARSPILRFEPSADGRTDIVIAAVAIRVMPVPRRVHQGWRYLEGADAPRDLADIGCDAADMPPTLRGELGNLGLI